MGPQRPLEPNPWLIRERREHTGGNMHRQLSFVMCMVSAANASVLIVCCRKHCESAAVCVNTLTEMGRMRWKACSKVRYKSGRIIVPGGEPFSTNKQGDRSHTCRITNTGDGNQQQHCLLSRLKTLVFFYFPTDSNSVSLAALLFMESRPISAQLSAGYRFTTAHWDGDRRPITGSWACKASICGGNTEQIKPEEPTHTHNPIRAAVMTLRSVFMHTKVS